MAAPSTGNLFGQQSCFLSTPARFFDTRVRLFDRLVRVLSALVIFLSTPVTFWDAILDVETLPLDQAIEDWYYNPLNPKA